jgi:ribonuclease VapC
VTLFADASALVAIIAGEAHADELANRIEPEQVRLCSAASAWETVGGLCRSHALSVPAARREVRRFLAAGDFEFTPIGEREFEIALDAYARYGKGRHPASLNMGDCFAYACAKSRGAELLFKGKDFGLTDIDAAM